MSKMGSYCSFEHLKHKLWPKERLFKSQKLTRFTYLKTTCGIRLETFNEGYNFALDLISIEGLITKL